MESTAYDEVEARAKLWRARMEQAYYSWYGAPRAKRTQQFQSGSDGYFCFYAESDTSDAYSVLGCSSYASNQELVVAYRHAVKRCHPDLVKGTSDDVLRRATESMVRLNAAWESIRKARHI